MKEFRTGMILPNGATVLEVKDKDDYRIVLAKWKKMGTEYIVWAMDALGNCYWGNYFHDFGRAAQNFVER